MSQTRLLPLDNDQRPKCLVNVHVKMALTSVSSSRGLAAIMGMREIWHEIAKQARQDN